jgi:hypothetical protein
MSEAHTVMKHAKNVMPKIDEVSERARRLVRRKGCIRGKTILFVFEFLDLLESLCDGWIVIRELDSSMRTI